MKFIIDAKGFPNGVKYYETFPREPSPLGMIDLRGVSTSKLIGITLDKVLDEVKGAGAGGDVLLVSHGTPEGFHFPLVTGARKSGESALKMIMIHMEAERLKAASGGTISAWTKLIRQFSPQFDPGSGTLAQVTQLFDKWESSQATAFGLSKATLDKLAKKANEVRALSLNRLEVRLCYAGASDPALKTIKQFFGAKQLVASTGATFFIPITPGRNSSISQQSQIKIPTVGDPLEVAFFRPARPSWKNLREFGVWVPSEKEIALESFYLSVVKLGPARYQARWRTVRRGTSAPTKERSSKLYTHFAKQWIMPLGHTKYNGGELPISGLLEPSGTDQIFVLPGEHYYVNCLKKI